MSVELPHQLFITITSITKSDSRSESYLQVKLVWFKTQTNPQFVFYEYVYKYADKSAAMSVEFRIHQVSTPQRGILLKEEL